MPVALALDLGTTSTAAVAVDEAGRLVQVVRRTHGADVEGLPAGHAQQDPRRHFESAVAVLRELSTQLTDIPVSLGLTGQMHSVVMLDSRRQPISNLITWQDRRANEVLDGDRLTYLERLHDRCRGVMMDNTGCRLAPGFAATSLFVLGERGEIPAEIERISLLADWIAAEMTNSIVVTERSNATSTGVYDLRNDRWSTELVSACGLNSTWLPDVVGCGVESGGLNEQTSTATGLPSGLPVVVPIGDNQASVIGSVPQGEAAIQITIGTGGQINWPVDSFVRIAGMETRPLPMDRLMLVGAGLVGGDAFAWVNRMVQQWLSAFGIHRGSEEIYSLLSTLASALPQESEGLTCEPFFRGTRQEPLRRASFAGIDTSNFTPGHVARAVLEGIAATLHEVWRGAGEHRPNVSRIIGCGNGLEKNPLLARIISEAFARPMFFPVHAEAAAYGAALLAGVTAGFWPDLTTAGRAIALRELPGAAS